MAQTKIMNTENFMENKLALNKCNKIFNTVPIIYIVMSVFYVVFGFMMIMSCSHEALLPILDAIFVSPLVVWLGLRASTDHHDLSAVGVPAIWGINCLLLYGASKNISGTVYFGVAKFNLASYCLLVNIIFLVVSIISCIMLMKTINKYRYLEAQVGFPYFNERVEQQRRNTIQRGIKDEFQQDYERRMRTASETMIDLEIPKAPEESDE